MTKVFREDKLRKCNECVEGRLVPYLPCSFIVLAHTAKIPIMVKNENMANLANSKRAKNENFLKLLFFELKGNPNSSLFIINVVRIPNNGEYSRIIDSLLLSYMMMEEASCYDYTFDAKIVVS